MSPLVAICSALVKAAFLHCPVSAVGSSDSSLFMDARGLLNKMSLDRSPKYPHLAERYLSQWTDDEGLQRDSRGIGALDISHMIQGLLEELP